MCGSIEFNILNGARFEWNRSYRQMIPGITFYVMRDFVIQQNFFGLRSAYYDLTPAPNNPDLVKHLPERRQKPSIAARLQEGAKQAKEHREPPAKKDGPAHQDR